MKKQFQYRVMNISEISAINKNLREGQKAVTWLDRLNELGKAGWEYTGTQPTEHSFLLKREVVAGSVNSDGAEMVSTRK